MNFLPGRLVHDGTLVQLENSTCIPLKDRLSGDAVTLGIRPEHLTLGGDGLTLAVDLIEPLGSETLVHGRVFGAGNEMIVARVAGVVMPAETVTVGVQPEFVHVFDAVTGKRIGPP
jgi:ABC-type sugar transport system ATPase subunit